MLGAVACFPIMQSCVKALLTQHDMSFVQATWGRYFFHLLLVPLLFPGTLSRLCQVERIGMQITRGVMLFLGTCAAFLSLNYLPLPQVTALSFIAPILVTILAATFLREAVGWRRWCAVLIGILGVVIIVDPSGYFSWAISLPLIMATFYSVYQVLTRAIHGSASPAVSLFFTAAVGALCASILVPFWWITPSFEAWLLLIGSALAGGCGHWLMIMAYERAEASFIAPFAYTEIIWASLLGYTLFDNTPSVRTAVGATIIVVSGIYIANRERCLRAKAPP
jgi:drug/metabolite transporter (DMT)-like permease